MEEYKVIDGYDNYEVSNMGNVRNKKTGLILKQSIRHYGYRSVTLYDNGNIKFFKVHRLVGLTFIPTLNNKLILDHIDRNTSNNVVTNLRWVSHSENSMNKSMQKNNTSTKTGVYYNKTSNNWKVGISINGKQKHIGYYTNFEDAVTARKEQEDFHFKEFQAFQNEIDRLEFEFQQAIK
jgi:hypothetical protein